VEENDKSGRAEAGPYPKKYLLSNVLMREKADESELHPALALLAGCAIA
jgi:hypothetical protein